MTDILDIPKQTAGIPVNDEAPANVGGQFNPSYTAISYIDISSDGKIRVATAHFANGGEFDETDAGWQNYISGAVSQIRGILDTSPLPTEAAAATVLGAVRFRYNFNEFTFKNKHHIFVALGGSLEFDKNHPFSFIRDVFLSDGVSTRRNAKNKSFVNAKYLDNYVSGYSMAYIQNRYRKSNAVGSDVDISAGDRLQYTININVKIPAATGPGVYIPLAIDPDTGNGMGPNP